MQNEFIKIEQKLQQFTKKYYTSELLKGIIVFTSLGFVYFFITLFVEYFLWLKPFFRSILFWLFVIVEVALFSKFIVIPIFKLIGLRKGISLKESSIMIGKHFPEVEDKLLNVIQLKESAQHSELLLASIAQKSKELQPIPFQSAIDYKANYKYLKYLVVPIFIYIFSFLTNITPDFSQSIDRVVNYKTAYVPPAPFSFTLQNKNLRVIQGNDISILISTTGMVRPEEVKIHFEEQYYFMESDNGTFEYTFSNVQKPISFYVEANGVTSNLYNVEIINAPTISNIQLELDYPKYLNKPSEITENNANIILPEGTNVTWQVFTNHTDSLHFKVEDKLVPFTLKNTNTFQLKKQVKNSFSYQISSSNYQLNNYEKLQFSVAVIQDEKPEITVTSNIDSISRGDAQFAGQISDDYGISKLNLVYYPSTNPESIKRVTIPTSKENIQTFFFQFPLNIQLKKGENYNLFFQVFDNDGYNGSKTTKSTVFTYRQKTDQEVEEELLQEQRNTINSLQNSLQNQKKQQEDLENLQIDLQNKKEFNWNDRKKVDKYLQRQEQYKKMMQRQTDKLQENIDEITPSDSSLQQKKQSLKERIQELKKLEKQQRLLDEIQQMANKLNKEDLVKKAKELAQQNKQQQRSLEKTLEMVKRFYVEQKTMQIANKIEELAKKQDALSMDETKAKEKQNDIKNEFNTIKKELDQLSKDNESLKEPLALPDVQQEEQEVSKEIEETLENLNNSEQSKSKQSHKKAAKKMQEMARKMEQAMMEMQGEAMEENIDDLRKILENLIIFSFEQEQLMYSFDEISTTHPNFGKNLNKQNQIKTYFNHIDDSLYVLSMRVPRISNIIQNDLSSIHYNLDQSLDNFSENRFSRGISNQRYVMTSTNNLADYLSNTLDNMMNNMSMKMGKGQKSNANSFSLPDLIEKQKGLSEQMKKGLSESNKSNDNKSEKKGKEGEGTNEDLDGELFEIYKQQNTLRQQLQEAIENNAFGTKTQNSSSKKVLQTMEELENQLLEQGFSRQNLEKMQKLNYEFLKLQTAKLQQGKDTKRESETNKTPNLRSKVKAIKFKKQYFNQIEILNRQSLPLQEIYKRKVRAYFSNQK